MKKFKVRALMTSVCYLEVEADDEDDAYRQGKDADGGIFIEEESEGSWQVTGVEDLTPPDPLNDIIAKLWVSEEEINQQCTDVQDQEEEKGDNAFAFNILQPHCLLSIYTHFRIRVNITGPGLQGYRSGDGFVQRNLSQA